MLLISSWISTVLPTPAPPNRPILPPRVYGASRSMTLMPVSRICGFGSRSSNSGGARWIDQRSALSGISSPLSIASPSTLKMRPSVTSPTGTEMGAPVSSTSLPRARPSVASIATARTRSSPRCCCTSATRIRSTTRDRDVERVVDRRQLAVEHGVEHDALDLHDPADVRSVCHVCAGSSQAVPETARAGAIRYGVIEARTLPESPVRCASAVSQAPTASASEPGRTRSRRPPARRA